MKIKLVKFPLTAIRDDLTLGKVYECTEPYPDSDYYEVIDDIGDAHEVEKQCFEEIEEETSEWSSKGILPPVGTVCYYVNDCGAIRGLGRIFAHHGSGGAFIEYFDFVGWDNSPDPSNFRPIKSEKQKEIDKIASELLESVNKNGEDFKHLEGPIAEHLYNAGLRFTGDK